LVWHASEHRRRENRYVGQRSGMHECTPARRTTDRAWLPGDGSVSGCPCPPQPAGVPLPRIGSGLRSRVAAIPAAPPDQGTSRHHALSVPWAIDALLRQTVWSARRLARKLARVAVG